MIIARICGVHMAENIGGLNLRINQIKKPKAGRLSYLVNLLGEVVEFKYGGRC